MAMIDTPAALNALVNRALDAPCVGIDTEFVWEQTYYPQLGIVQVGFAADDSHLIDAVALPDLSPLGALLADCGTVKILHDAQQDLWILRRATGAVPRNIFDTRCAAGFVGMGSTLSLNNSLRLCLDIQLTKTETRTDWLRRPLSEKQRAYAADDVRFLPALRDHLLAEIRQRGRENYLADELRQYDCANLYDDRVPEEQYLRVKGASRLSRREMGIVRDLATWREQKARQIDRPKNRVLRDEVIVQIAKRKPQSIQALKKLRGIGRSTAKYHGRILLEIVQRAIDIQNHPPLARPTPPNPVDEARLDLALAFLRGRCLSRGIDIAMVASRTDVKALVYESKSETAHPLHTGWRYEFVGADLIALLNGERALRIDPQTRLPEFSKRSFTTRERNGPLPGKR